MKRQVELTPREVDITKLIIDGLSNKAIGEKLFISHHTVKANLENIFRKTGVSNRIMLAVWAVRNNII